MELSAARGEIDLFPDALESPSEVPEERFSERDLELRLGDQHRLFLRTWVVSTHDLARWLEKVALAAEGSGARR